MKKLILTLTAIIIAFWGISQNLKPYLGGLMKSNDINKEKVNLKNTLTNAGFNVVGAYQPADDANRWVIIYNHSLLNKAVTTNKGLRGFALTQRVALTKQENGLYLSFTNPAYWGAAYFQDDYEDVKSNYEQLESKVKSLAAEVGVSNLQPYGSKEGIELDDLQEYQYMFGMPYFDDVVEVASFDDHQSALNKIDENLKKNGNQKLVYKYTLPNSSLVLYGVELDGETGENKFVPIIDISSPQHTCFLPYELLVDGKNVYMLHGRFRIALSFPDLTMGTFTKIMSTPGDIEEAMENLVK